MLCKTLKNDSPRPRIRIPRKTAYPSYLYRRGQLFSFRYVLPERYRKQGKTELRLSPQTPYLSGPRSQPNGCSKRPLRWQGCYGLRSAQTADQRPTPGYSGIRYARFSERPSLTILGIGTLPYGEYCNHNSNIDHLNLQTEKGLSAVAQNVISLLLRQRLIRQEHIRPTQYIFWLCHKM